MTILVVTAITFAQQPVQPQSGKSLKDINNQIVAAKQSKNLAVRYFDKVNTTQIQSTKMVLGTQQLSADNQPTATIRDFGTSGSGDTAAVGVKIPTWELVSFFSFEGTSLLKSADEFMLTFYVYNQRFPVDSELKITADGQEMKFTLINKGRKLTSEYGVAEGVNGKDKNTDDQRSNAGNISQDAKPFYSTFKLTGAEFEKIVNAEKVRFSLTKQYEVNLRKEYRAILKTMLDASKVN
jgi:hypothetical protein